MEQLPLTQLNSNKNHWSSIYPIHIYPTFTAQGDSQWATPQRKDHCLLYIT